MEVLQLENFESICRICFGTESLSSLFEIIYEDKYLSEILWECTSIRVRVDDKLPKKICLNCIQGLCSAYNFLNLCNDANNMLLTMVSDHKDQMNEENIEESIIIKIENENEEEMPAEREAHEASETTEISQKKIGSNYLCVECNESFTTLFEFVHHFHIIRHIKNENQCPLCEKSFHTLKTFKRHLYYHSGWFICNICDKKFNFLSNLKKHVFTHGRKSFICDLCGKGLTSAWSLHEHLAYHTKQKWCMCHKCGKQFSKYSKFHLHMKAHDYKQGHRFRKCYDCVFCDKTCKTYNFLKLHLMEHVEGPSTLEVTPEVKDAAPKRVSCYICEKTFKSKYILEAHMKLHSDERPYTCYCGKTFRMPYNLKVHQRIHTGEKPYICSVCNRSFAQKQQLNTHMRTHTLEKPFTCNYCGKAFATRGNATVHMRLHTGETPFVCSICSKGYVDSSGLKRHKCTLPYGNTVVVFEFKHES